VYGRPTNDPYIQPWDPDVLTYSVPLCPGYTTNPGSVRPKIQFPDIPMQTFAGVTHTQNEVINCVNANYFYEEGGVIVDNRYTMAEITINMEGTDYPLKLTHLNINTTGTKLGANPAVRLYYSPTGN
jgi:hypothetical protein